MTSTSSLESLRTMWGDNPEFDLKAITHFLMVCRGVERPSDEFRLGPSEHPTQPSSAAMTYLKNGIEFYAESREGFRRFLDTVVRDYSSPTTTHETFHSDFYRDLQTLLEVELQSLTSDAESERDRNA